MRFLMIFLCSVLMGFCTAHTESMVVDMSHDIEFHDDLRDTIIPYPWAQMDMTNVYMKPGYPFVKDKKIIWPYLIGIPVSGGVVYVLTQDSEEDVSCEITVQNTITSSTCGMSNGQIVLDIIASEPVTSVWSNNIIGNTNTDLFPGNYSVTISSTESTCQKVISYTVPDESLEISIETNTVNTDCNTNNGSIELLVSPQLDYRFLWSDGSDEQNRSDLEAGPYTVTVSYGNCSAIETIIVDEIANSFVVDTEVIDSDCGANNGSANVIIEPPSTYSIIWSNGEEGAGISNLEPGQYSVTVVDSNGCSNTAELIINELEPDFRISVSTTPATCDLSDGQAVLTLEPEGNYTYLWPDGTTENQNKNLPKGEYTVTVSNILNCIDSITFAIEDTTPVIAAVNDTFKTEGLSPLNENVLVNDTGLSLSLIEIDSVSGGTVSFMPDGQISFMPDPTVDRGSFVYIVRDTCQQQDTAKVLIEIITASCDFEVEFDGQNASCGDDDGMLEVKVIDSGNYTYVWEDGTTGAILTGVGAGSYEVTVTDLELGCDLVFTGTIDEDPVDYIIYTEIIQPSCALEAYIIFELEDEGFRNYIVEVLFPEGVEYIYTLGDVIFLGDYIELIPGEYVINVWDEDIGPPCVDGFEALILPQEDILIEVVNVTSTSSPSASDGTVTVEILAGGNAPYTILLNGEVQFTTIGSTFTISGLASSEYTIQVLDTNGCPSNIVEVFIPFGTSLGFQPSTAFIHQAVISNNSEYPTSLQSASVFGLQGNFKYRLLENNFSSSITQTILNGVNDFIFSQTIMLYQLNCSDLSIRFNGGFISQLNDLKDAHYLMQIDLETILADEYRVSINLGAIMNSGSVYPATRLEIGLK